MARYTSTVVSAASLGAGTTFANLVAGASVNYKLRRVHIGVVAGASAPTSQQVEIGLYRATARGTATTTVAAQAIDPRSAASGITGLDTVWSVAPTLAANPMYRWAFNTQSGMDIPLEFIEELICDQGTANGFALENLVNALPAAHSLVLTLTHEE